MQQYILKPEDLRILIYKQKSFVIAYRCPRKWFQFGISTFLEPNRYRNFHWYEKLCSNIF